MGSETTPMNRWLVVVGALLIQICLGAIYAWSVFTPALTATEPRQLAAIYSARQLGIDPETFNTMNQELEAPQAKLKNTSAKWQGTLAKLEQTTDEAEREALEERRDELQKQREELEAEINSTVRDYVPAENFKAIEYGFSKVKSQWIFSVGLAFFAIVMVLAGRMMPTTGPRALATAGGIALGIGYVLAGLLGGQSFLLHLIFIGVVGGSGIGLAYVVPIAVAMRWFPDKKGLITGLAVAGFGFGAMGWVKIAGAWFGLISLLGLPTVFIVYGIAFLVIVVVGSVWMVFPPEGWKPEGWSPPEPKTASGPAAGTVNFTSGEMLRTPQYYMIVLVFTFSAGAGLMSIGLMKLFPSMALVQNGMDAVKASAVAGTAMAVFFSLA
ncbi:MAG: MFS transporter, partial [Planctomycetota bacterium]